MHAFSRSVTTTRTPRPAPERAGARASPLSSTPPPSPPPASAAAARTAAAALLAAAQLAAACSSSSATALEPQLPSASPPESIVRRLPPPPPAPRPLPPVSQALRAAPPLLGPYTLEANGLRLFMIEDHEAPLVRGTLLLKGGSRAVPAEKLGMGAITAAAQRSGGSLTHPGPLLDEALADLAADIEVSAGPLAFSFDFGCLSSDAARVLPLVAELAREPLFPEDRVAAARAQVLASLAHADDDAGSYARRRLLEALYGRGSVYARHPTAATAGSVTRDDVAAFARAWQRPDGAVLGLAGDFQALEMRALVERAFGDWAPAPGEPETPPEVPSSRPPELPPQVLSSSPSSSSSSSSPSPLVYLVDRPGLPQASVVAGEPGVALSDPDAPALDVLQTALNSFGGALFDALRSRDALAYSVGASWDAPADHRGTFVAAADTSRPAELLVELRRALADVASGGGGGGGGGGGRGAPSAAPSEEAVARAREQSLEQFAFSIGGTPARMARAVSYDVLGLPQDFALQYRDRLARVRRADVLGAAARWLHPGPGGQVVIVAGDGAVVRPELEAAGFRVEELPKEEE